MRTVSLAALQLSCSWTRDENIAKADRLVREAARQGAQVALRPELFETPYFCAVQNIGDRVHLQSVGRADPGTTRGGGKADPSFRGRIARSHVRSGFLAPADSSQVHQGSAETGLRLSNLGAERRSHLVGIPRSSTSHTGSERFHWTWVREVKQSVAYFPGSLRNVVQQPSQQK